MRLGALPGTGGLKPCAGGAGEYGPARVAARVLLGQRATLVLERGDPPPDVLDGRVSRKRNRRHRAAR